MIVPCEKGYLSDLLEYVNTAKDYDFGVSLEAKCSGHEHCLAVSSGVKGDRFHLVSHSHTHCLNILKRNRRSRFVGKNATRLWTRSGSVPSRSEKSGLQSNYRKNMNKTRRDVTTKVGFSLILRRWVCACGELVGSRGWVTPWTMEADYQMMSHAKVCL